MEKSTVGTKGRSPNSLAIARAYHPPVSLCQEAMDKLSLEPILMKLYITLSLTKLCKVLDPSMQWLPR